MYKEPPPGLYIAADENDITKVCVQNIYCFVTLPVEINLSYKAK